MNKEELVEGVAQRCGLSKTEASSYLDTFVGVVEENLGKGEEIRVTGFGKFSVRERPAREGRNPQTGEPMQIAASKTPVFSAGSSLKNAV